MTRQKLTSLALASAVALLACGGAGGGRAKFAITHAEKRAELDNGLKLVIVPDKSTPMVQVDVRYAVGANEDPPGKAGLAHYVEHMMFQWRLFGPEGPDLFTVLPTIVTSMNAYTAPDRTHYWLSAPKEELRKLLDLEARRMALAQSKCEEIPEAEFKRELDVVRNEIRRQLGTAQGLILPTVLEKIYPEGHPYSHTAGGNDAQLVTITKKDVCDFMKKYYVPARATLVVAGNVDVDQVGKDVQGYFGEIPSGEPAPRKKVEAVATKEAKHEVKLDIPRPVVVVAWALPPKDNPDSIKGQLAAGALNSRLGYFASEWDFATSAQVIPLGYGKLNAVGGPRSPLLLAFAELKPGGDVDEALDYIWKAAGGAHRGLDYLQDQLGNKDQIALQRANYIMSLEPLSARTEEIANLIQFGKGTDFNGGSEYLIDQLKSMDDVESADYESFVKRTLDRKNATVFVFRPDESAASGDQRAAGKLGESTDHYAEKKPLIDPREAEQPATYPKEPGVLATAESYELANGMKVVLLPYDGMPVVSTELRFDVGSVHEKPENAGQASMAADFLLKPKGADVYARLGLQTSSGGGMNSTSFSARGITNYLPEILTGLERWVVAGYYDQEMIEKWQDSFGKNIKRPEAVRSRAFAEAWHAAVYGPGHPYTTNGSPTPKTYKKIGRDMLDSWRGTYFKAGNATLIVAGKFDKEEARRSIKDVFGGWDKGKVVEKVTTPAVTQDGAKYIGVVGDDEQNANIMMFWTAGSGIDTATYGARQLASTMINQRMGNIRTRLGSTYGVGGGWSANIGPSIYRMGGLVESARAGESLKVMREELDALRRGQNFNIEFVRARRSVMKKLLGQSTESYRLSAQLSRGSLFGLPRDFNWQTMKNVATSHPAQVRALINEEIPQKQEIIVIQADKDTLKETFAAIGVEDFTLIEPVTDEK